MKGLPDIYWMPKLHKSLVGFRLIIASRQRTAKSLSKFATSAFKMAYKQIEVYNNKSRSFLGLNRFS